MEMNENCDTGPSTLQQASNSKLNEDSIKLNIPGGLQLQYVLKLKPNCFSNSNDEKISDDGDLLNNKHLCEESLNNGRACEECHVLNMSHDSDHSIEKVYSFQDLLKSDCGDNSLGKSYLNKDHSNASIDNANLYKNMHEKVHEQDGILNMPEWLFNMTSDKKHHYSQSNAIIDINDTLSDMQNSGSFESAQSSSVSKTIKLESCVNKNNNIANNNSGSGFKVNCVFDPDMEDNKSFTIGSLQNLEDVISFDSKSLNKTSDLSKFDNNINENKHISNKFVIDKRKGNNYIFNNIKHFQNNDSPKKLNETKLQLINYVKKENNKNNVKSLSEKYNIMNEESSFRNVSENIIVKPVKILSRKKVTELNKLHENGKYIVDVNEKEFLAKVTFTVDYNAENVKVAIFSSNKRQTVFKINTKNVVKAVESIKNSSLKNLGINSEQMLFIATSAMEQLDYNLELVAQKVNKHSDAGVKIPNLSVTHFVKEDPSIIENPILYNKEDGSYSKNIIQVICNSKSNINAAKKEQNNNDNLSKAKMKSYETNKNRRKCLADNVSFSLLSGSSPTMVSRPSLLDSLPSSTESEKNLMESISNEDNEKLVDPKLPFMSISENKVLKFLKDLGITLDSLEFYCDPASVKNWRCPINSCPESFTKLSKLKVHILSHDGIRPFKCTYDHCGWSFYTSYKLKRHLQTHLKRKHFLCSEVSCNKKFTTIYNLNTHMLLHQKPKTCACFHPNCNATFKNKKELEKHMQHHENHRYPFKCNVDGCTKGFCTTSSLALHSRSHHNDEDLRCSWDGCGKKFDKPCRLKMHMRVHTGHRPYACTFEGCQGKFKCASKLSRHQKVHTNDRKYSCAICKKAFLRAEHLKGHLLTHSGVRNFHCHIPNCESKFTAKSSLYVHLKKHKMLKNDAKSSSNSERSSAKNLQEQNSSTHLSYLGPEQMDYITLIGDKDFSCENQLQNCEKIAGLNAVIPFSFQHDPSHKQLHSGIVAPQDTVLMQFLDGTNSIALPLDSHESTISLSVSDSLFPQTMSEDPSHIAVDLGFLDVNQKDSREATTTTKDYKKSYASSSARADILNSIILSQKKQRNVRCYSRQHDDSPIRTMFSTNDVILSDIVNDASKLQTSQQDDPANAFYADGLSTQDILNYPTQQSTINLRDLE